MRKITLLLYSLLLSVSLYGLDSVSVSERSDLVSGTYYNTDCAEKISLLSETNLINYDKSNCSSRLSIPENFDYVSCTTLTSSELVSCEDGTYYSFSTMDNEPKAIIDYYNLNYWTLTYECLKLSLPAAEVCPLVDGVQWLVNPDTCECYKPCVEPSTQYIESFSTPTACSDKMAYWQDLEFTNVECGCSTIDNPETALYGDKPTCGPGIDTDYVIDTLQCECSDGISYYDESTQSCIPPVECTADQYKDTSVTPNVCKDNPICLPGEYLSTAFTPPSCSTIPECPINGQEFYIDKEGCDCSPGTVLYNNACISDLDKDGIPDINDDNIDGDEFLNADDIDSNDNGTLDSLEENDNCDGLAFGIITSQHIQIYEFPLDTFCDGSIAVRDIYYTDLANDSKCDCYGIPSEIVSCAELEADMKALCYNGQVLGNCDDTKIPVRADFYCNSGVICEDTIKDFATTCFPPNTVGGGCSDDGIKITSNTLVCNPPPKTPCEEMLDAKTITCNGTLENYEYCVDDGNVVISEKFFCRELVPDSNGTLVPASTSEECDNKFNEVLNSSTSLCECLPDHTRNDFGDCWKNLPADATVEEIQADQASQEETASIIDESEAQAEIDKQAELDAAEVESDESTTQATVGGIRDDLNDSNEYLRKIYETLDSNKTFEDNATVTADKKSIMEVFDTTKEIFNNIISDYESMKTTLQSGLNDPVMSSGIDPKFCANIMGKTVCIDLCESMGVFRDTFYYIFVSMFMLTGMRIYYSAFKMR